MMPAPDEFPTPLIQFDIPEIDFDLVGGKGANLVRLSSAGFNVPPGFLVPTTAYSQFVTNNNLDDTIEEILDGIDPSSLQELETASEKIRGAFSTGKVSEPLEDALQTGWQQLGSPPVAVRSSATAEDLPDMSFAGQQDTFLNVIGEMEIVKAVVKCWSSLWTARAIGYRTRNQIPHTEVTLSVVIQQMVESEASGVMFTANPLTGLRSEVVIDATLGLGEALVSGQVEPDHYIVDTETQKITRKIIGSKAVVMRGKTGGGIHSQTDQPSQFQALPDSAIIQLASLGTRIDTLYNFPQDIEWAWKDGELYILQSRPITSLYPLPKQEDDSTRVYFSFGAVQGMLDPMTPLGQDTIRLIFVGGASLFNVHVNHKTQGVIYPGGQRLWANITGVLRNPIGARIIPRIFPGIEPGSLPTLQALLKDPKVGGGSGHINLRTIRKVAGFMFKMQRKAFHQFRTPEEKAAGIKAQIDKEISRIRALYATPADDHLPLADIPKLYREIRDSFPFAVPEIASGVLAGLLPMLLLDKLAKQSGVSTDLVLELTRGLPNNPTTEMDLILWATAREIKQDAESITLFSQQPAAELAEAFLHENLPPHTQTQLQKFLDRYGMRGLAEIDIGRPRWRENPTQIIQTIQSYLKIDNESLMPDVVFERGALRAAEAQAELEQAVLKTHGGKMKAKLVRAVTRRIRALGGLRESPKFYIIQLMGIIRKEMLKTGQVLVEQGKLNARDDLFFLYLQELEAFARGEQGDWKALIQEHRLAYQSEMRRRQIPRLLVSDGRTFYEGLGDTEADSDSFRGSPVSPGIVEGQVRVLIDPHTESLHPGEILVCPATDPAWTPLFLAAGGLIMETGGLMTHGAIVAREYGIPAVVGVNEATLRLKTGDRIRLDGATGLIEKLG